MYLGDGYASRGNEQCKGPEVGAGLDAQCGTRRPVWLGQNEQGTEQREGRPSRCLGARWRGALLGNHWTVWSRDLTCSDRVFK